MQRAFFILLLLFQTLACAPKEASTHKMASAISDAVVCRDPQVREKIFEKLKEYLLKEKVMLSSEDLGVNLNKYFESFKVSNNVSQDIDVFRVKVLVGNLIIMLLREAPEGERIETPNQLVLLLSALDVGDQSTPFRAYLQKKIQQTFWDLEQSTKLLNASCSKIAQSAALPRSSQNADFEYHKQKLLNEGESLAVMGERWAFATAYQSCQSIHFPDLDDGASDVQGISIIGKHPDGIGSRRLITDLGRLQKTNLYILFQESKGPSCFDVFQNPLIYDYGGKPYATLDADSPLDLFRDFGDGTKALGIDCSGFVYTALSTAGLRFKKGRELKASDAWAWGSGSYLEPQANGLTCFDKISVTPYESVKAGDIIAVPGHVLIIDKVGLDPFGLEKIKNENECSNISSEMFDFAVVQSSPSKGGVGINYYEAKSYLKTSLKMKVGLEKYAFYACQARFSKKTFVPNLGSLSVVRHLGTSECFAPRIALQREACIQTCSTFMRH
jgi:hypothetical protein